MRKILTTLCALAIATPAIAGEAHAEATPAIAGEAHAEATPAIAGEAHADKPVEKQKKKITIIVDDGQHCYGGRIADYYRNKASRVAWQKARELKKQGYKVSFIYVSGMLNFGRYFNYPAPVFMPGC